MDRVICKRSEVSFFFVTGVCRHWDAGLARKCRIFQITKMLISDPKSANSIIGIRIAS